MPKRLLPAIMLIIWHEAGIPNGTTHAIDKFTRSMPKRPLLAIMLTIWREAGIPNGTTHAIDKFTRGMPKSLLLAIMLIMGWEDGDERYGGKSGIFRITPCRIVKRIKE